jgi:hypothetical protein
MKIFSVEGNTQKLDGSAMFGNCRESGAAEMGDLG